MRDPFWSGVWRQDQIDVNGDCGRCGNDGRLRPREDSLRGGCERVPLDPHKFFFGGIEDSNARQRHSFRERVDDEKFVFHMVLAVVGADNLGLVYRTDEDCSRLVAPRGRSGPRKGEDSGHHETDAHLSFPSCRVLKFTETRPSAASL
jgi:hypothetical protein